MNNYAMLARVDVGGDGFINQLVTFLIIGICVALIYLAGRWYWKRPSVPPVALTIWDGLFILVGLIVIINFLLGLTGNSFIKW